MPQQSSAPALGTPFIELQSVDSTNNYALAQVHAGLAHHGAAFFAWEQTAGKGQRGRSWTSQKEANIMISLVIRPYPLQVTQQFHLIACVAVAVNAFYLHYAGSET
ncbi:MAG TPA: biotin--[acetyl-CoA-carboxylase] ligase, partial [Chitinophagaceae bacterium]|nr:biotin--[acetyl-CoA-carboxylase] ligase [Chitinophagaceae bacterium]